MESAGKQLFNYLQDVIYDPAKASLEIDELPEDLRDFGRGLQYYVDCVQEVQQFAGSMSKGDLSANHPSRGNEVAGQLKALHASLKHLTWQTQQIEQGDYTQRVEFMGEFSDSFNTMTNQLAQRNKDDSNERARLQQYIDLLLLTTPDIILVLDTEGKAVLASDSYTQQRNKHSPGDFQGKRFKELFAPFSSHKFLDEMDRMINNVLIDGNTIEVVQYIDFERNGNKREYSVFINPMQYDKETILGVLLSFHDMTEIKQAQRESERARELAEQSTKAKSSFLASMSHEIRTPMNAILGVTEIMLQNRSLPEGIEDGLDMIYTSSNLLLGIINDILDFSKIEAGKLDIIPAQYDVASMINDSVHLNVMRIGSKPIKFELEIDENIPSKMFGDVLRIKQILNNLLSNSFKYTDSGTVVLSVTSEPVIPTVLSAGGQQKTADDADVTLVMSVKDTGHGMTKEQLNSLFEEYSRLYNETEKYIEGTGLGLTITQCLIDLMGGEISVESESGVGSRFTIRLPQRKADSEVVGKEAAVKLRQFRTDHLMNKERHRLVREPMPYGRILIVDDVETNLYVASGLLKPYKLQVETAMSGREAIDKIKSGKIYDVVFMDHMMPEMDGIETVKHMRESGYSAPVVALTANAVTGQADMFLNNGFDAFISKPIDIRRLDIMLNKFVRDKQPQKVRDAARLRNNEEAMHEGPAVQGNDHLLESFIRDGRKALVIFDEIHRNNEYYKEESLQNYTIAVHGMKSSLINIGEPTLSEHAGQLERAGREKNVLYIVKSAPEFSEKIRALLERIEPKTTEADETEDVEALRNTLSTIKELCAEYNRKAALDLISDVKHCTRETKTILNSINSYVGHSDFEEAEAVAAAYMSRLNATRTGRRKKTKSIAQ